MFQVLYHQDRSGLCHINCSKKVFDAKLAHHKSNKKASVVNMMVAPDLWLNQSNSQLIQSQPCDALSASDFFWHCRSSEGVDFARTR